MTQLKSGHIFSLWIYAILLPSAKPLGGSAWTASTAVPALPAPVLSVVSRSRGSVEMVCRAPASQRGVLFILYRFREQVDTWVDQQGSVEAQFTVKIGRPAQEKLYCCLYQNPLGYYSAVSPYLTLEHQQPPGQADPPPAQFPSPILSVEPPSGHVRHGQMISFSCSLPVTQPQFLSQSQKQPQHGPKPVAFLLMKTDLVSGATSVVLQPQASQMSNSTAQTGAFSVGPVRGGEGGSYSCLYQYKRRALLNSTASNVVKVTVTDLPRPILTLQRQKGLWYLYCMGSPAYPGALFSLYQGDDKQPVATHQATMTSHTTTFPIPVQDDPSMQYRCQYSALLDKTLSHSERSPPTVVTQEISPPSTPGSSGVDWPLVAGSFSAVVLFLSALLLVAVVVRRKVRAAAAEKKKREEAEFWSTAHGKDLTPRQSSFNHQEWANERSSSWNPLSTFTSPTFQ